MERSHWIPSLILAASVVLASADATLSQTTYIGGSNEDIGDETNWDNGLPTNDGTNDGLIPTGNTELFGSPAFKRILVEGTSGFDGDFAGELVNGFDLTIEGTGDSTFIEFFVNWDEGAANVSRFAWNSLGAMTTPRLWVGRFDNGHFAMSAGTVNQNQLGIGDFGMGELAGAAGSTFTVSGGTLDAFGRFDARRGTFTMAGGLAIFRDAAGIDFNDDNSGAPFTLTLAGGTLRTEDLVHLEGGDVIDFTAGSAAALDVLSSNLDVAAAQSLITNGWITLGGQAAEPADFSITIVNIGAVDYTRIVVPVFADGFESGDTSEWSGVVP